MEKNSLPFSPTAPISHEASLFLYFPLITRAALFAVAFFLSCSTYPTGPSGKDLYEMESVWQYLKTYSLWQDKVPVSAFTYGSPREMMKSVQDTLKGLYYTKYYNDPSHSSSRALVESDSAANTTVGWDSLSDATAYLRILEFSSDDSSTFFQFLSILPRLQNFSNIIIDLIDNTGGGIAVTDAIINSILPINTPYILETYRSYDQSTHTASTIPWDTLRTTSGQDPALKNKRYVVLMDSMSASASEILIAALKDGFVHGNGDTVVLIGETSYGKGMGQIHISRTPWKRPDLLITFIRMKGISERTGDYHRKGIAPDVFVPHDFSHMAQITAALKILEPAARLNKQALLQKQLMASGGIRPEAHIIAAPAPIPN